MPQLLASAVEHGSALAGSTVGRESDRIEWLECYTGKRRVTEFCESTDPVGNFESNSSAGHKEYQDRLRTIALREEGLDKSEIATALGRSVKFVQTWWRKSPKEVPRPQGVHDYLKTEFWRDIEIVRGFGKDLGVYDEVVPATEWYQPMADGSAFSGGYRLKYDKEGRMRPQGNQNAKDGLLPGKYPNLDKLTQRLLVDQGIDDRVLKRPGMLWYPDGSADAIEHRHEAWTALLSFGAPRILTIDKHPVLLRDGDLIVFGTQRHGVPKMCNEGSAFDDYGGRISVVFFFMPNGKQAQGSAPWRAIVDDDGPSKKMAAMVRDADLGATAAMQGLRSGGLARELADLEALGFETEDAISALRVSGKDVNRAAELLINGTCRASLMDVGGETLTGSLSKHEQVVALYARLSEIQCIRNSRDSKLEVTDTANGSHASDDAGDIDGDAALARRLQDEETGTTPADQCGMDSYAWEEHAILEMLQDLERDELTDKESLQKQFAAYDEMLAAKDAEDWDGRGDLMVREWRRSHLHIEQQSPVTLYAFGCGKLREQVFFELLSLHSVRVLYDFRASPEKASCNHFAVRNLEIACKARGIVYRHIALGRETAYGILKHLREDEGRNSLAEIVWHAQRKRSAFLGSEEDWHLDHRLAVAMRLVQAGHKVIHVLSDGSLEEHPEGIEIPDHISGEEARLRMLEKQRLAGELKKATKSAAYRSTEVVAQKLSQPQKEIDVGAELRNANTQAELCRAQRRLADMQRKNEESSDASAGLGPKLLNVNKWVKAEAARQRDNLASGLTKDGKTKSTVPADRPPVYAWTGGGGTDGGNPDFFSAASSSSSTVQTGSECIPVGSDGAQTLMVECNACSVMLPWDVLEEGDGRCIDCRALAAAGSACGPSRNHSHQDASTEGTCASAQHDTAIAPGSVEAGVPRSTWRSRRKEQRRDLTPASGT